MDLAREARLLAETQYSVLATWQAHQLGISKDVLYRWTQGPDWEYAAATVVRLCGSDRSDGQFVMTAVLDAGPGSVLSIHSGASWWGLPGYDLRDLHVLRSRDGTSRRGRLARLHYPTLLPPHHVTAFRRVPVVTPARLMFDLAGWIHPGKMERTLETAWSRGMFNGKVLYRVKNDLKGRGRRGNAVMNELLAERPPDYRAAESNLELRVQKILRNAGITGFERQVNLGDEEHFIGRIDLYHRHDKVCLEVQSDLYHGALIDKAADATRRRRLTEAGFRFVEATEFEAWHRPRAIIERVRPLIR